MKDKCIRSFVRSGWIIPAIFTIVAMVVMFSCRKTDVKDKVIENNPVQLMERHAQDTISNNVSSVHLESPKEGEFEIDSCTSPAAFILIVWGPSDMEGQYYFYRNKTVVCRYYNEEAMVGRWELNDTIINITYNRKYYREGIGDPISVGGGVPGNYVAQYHDYEYLSEDIDQTEFYNWTEIKRGIKNKKGLYELVSYRLDENTFESVVDLQKGL